MPTRAHWPDYPGDQADQLAGELARAPVTGQPRPHRRVRIPAGSLPIHTRLLSDFAQACTR
jgi:hypothetical protein